MFTRNRHRRGLVLEVLDTRLALSGFGGIGAAAAAQVSFLPSAGQVELNPQPLPPRIMIRGDDLGAIADELNPQPLPPGPDPALLF